MHKKPKKSTCYVIIDSQKSIEYSPSFIWLQPLLAEMASGHYVALGHYVVLGRYMAFLWWSWAIIWPSSGHHIVFAHSNSNILYKNRFDSKSYTFICFACLLKQFILTMHTFKLNWYEAIYVKWKLQPSFFFHLTETI